MSRIRAAGGAGGEWERRPIEAARRAELGHDPPPGLPPCTAPFAVLVIGADRRVRGCAPGMQAWHEGFDRSWEQVWSGPIAAALRARLAAGELPDDHCRTCTGMLRAGVTAGIPPIRDYGSELPAGAAPHRVVLQLDDGPTDGFDDAACDWLRPLLRLGPTVELAAADLLRHPSFPRLAALLRDGANAVELTTDALPEDAPARLAGLTPSRLRLRLRDEALPLERAAGLAGALEVELLLTPANWFRMPALAQTCAALGARLRLRVTPPDGRPPLGDLPIVELRALYYICSGWWAQLGSDARPPSLAAHEFTALLGELRAWLGSLAQQGQQDPEPVLAGRARWRMPPVDDAVLTSEPWQRQTLPVLLGLYRSPSLRAWTDDFVAGPQALADARRQPWLRVLLQKLALDEAVLPLRELLRELYAPEATRAALLRDEAALMARLGLADLARRTAREHGLDLPPRTGPAFADRPPAAPPAGAPDVTVLIPSYRHEAYVEATLHSVLGQTYGAYRVLVVDDRSPDATVARARSVRDPRIEVIVNERNLGLGSSVLQALDSITTPYVALLNSDDLFHPERLARCRELLERRPECQVATTGVRMIDAAGHPLAPDNVSRLLDTRRVADLVQWFAGQAPSAGELAEPFLALLRRNFLATSSNLFCRTAFLREQADALRNLKYCLDWQLFLAAAAADALAHDPAELIAYRLHAANTVWFRDGSHCSYYLEVNRVAARAIRTWLRARPRDAAAQRRSIRALQAVLGPVLANNEVDGLALYLNELIAGPALERLVGSLPWVQQALAERDARIQAAPAAQAFLQRAGGDPWRALDSLRELPHLRLADVLRDVHRDEAAAQRATAAWAQQEVERLHGVDAERAAALQREATLRQRIVAAATRAGLAAGADFAGDLDRIDAAVDALQSRAKRLADERQLVEEARQRLAAAHAELGDRHEALRREQERTAAELRQTARELESARQRWSADLDAMRGSHEYRLGHFLWHRVPGTRKLVRMAQRLRRWARRWAGWFRRRSEAPAAAAPHRRQAIVAATGRFPIGSHAFVYQEMLGLRDAGFDVTLFHWYREPRELLREGFEYLWEHALQLQADWGLHEADLDHWKRTQPGRLEALLARMAAASGIPANELETRWELMQAYTFARMAESRGAAYVHSYFFYEQSLSAMVTAWLLGIPRGITAYADHMLDDWPLKLVALHVELADVVVATSRRIQRELIGIAGERFAPKILVKPNGIDGRPFAGPDRPQPVDGPFPLISVSRLEPKKGLLVLVDAVHLLVQRGRDVVVHVVGAADADNPTSMAYAERFVARLAELGLTDRFVLHGFQRQAGIAKLLREARVFVAPYVETATGDKDGIPTAMLEAMASGLPILATDAGSILEVVSDGVEGLVVPQREPEQLAGAIERLIDAPALRDALGQRARQRFEREFDSRVTEKLLHDRIATLLARPRAAAEATQPALAVHGAAGA